MKLSTVFLSAVISIQGIAADSKNGTLPVKKWDGCLVQQAAIDNGNRVELRVYKYYEYSTGQEFYFIVAVARDFNGQPQVAIHSIQVKK